MESLLPILTAFAATDAPLERTKRSNGLSDFPCEEPSEKELEDWLNENGPHVRLTHGAILRGETPPNLVNYDYQDDLTGFAEIAAPSGEDAGAAAKRQAHNLKVRQMQQANATRKAALDAGLLEAKNVLAQALITALRPNAPLRLEALLTKHAIPSHAEAYDGPGMWKDLEALRGSTGLLDETRDHDREVERMRDEYLPDGCAVQDYSDKVNRLIKDHVPHLERPLAGPKLGGFIIRLMPKCNAAEGRALHRELEAAGTLGAVSTVVRRCVEIVKSSQAPGAHAAAAAVRRGLGPRPCAAAAIPALTEAITCALAATGSGSGGNGPGAAERAKIVAAAAAAQKEREAKADRKSVV